MSMNPHRWAKTLTSNNAILNGGRLSGEKMVRSIRWKAPWVLTFFGMLAVVTFSGLAQVSQQESQTSPQGAGGAGVPQGGAATGGVFAPVLDAEKRPITPGGFVKTGPIIFQDTSEKAGLTAWHHKMGTPQKNYILEATGSGVALVDYDNDGWLDIYLVNGSTLEALDGKAEPPHAALFHNNHDGTFTDVASQAGVTTDRWG